MIPPTKFFEEYFWILIPSSSTYSKDSIISTVSIKRTVRNSSLMTLLNVLYDLYMSSSKDKRTVSIKRTFGV